MERCARRSGGIWTRRVNHIEPDQRLTHALWLVPRHYHDGLTPRIHHAAHRATDHGLAFDWQHKLVGPHAAGRARGKHDGRHA